MNSLCSTSLRINDTCTKWKYNMDGFERVEIRRYYYQVTGLMQNKKCLFRQVQRNELRICTIINHQFQIRYACQPTLFNSCHAVGFIIPILNKGVKNNFRHNLHHLKLFNLLSIVSCDALSVNFRACVGYSSFKR